MPPRPFVAHRGHFAAEFVPDRGQFAPEFVPRHHYVLLDCGHALPDRTLILTRYTELNAEQKILVKQLKLDLPVQSPPRITALAGEPAPAGQHV
jgi:hypothetical protein